VAQAPDSGFAPRRILIIRLSALGDVIRTLPILPPLRARFPDAAVDWVCEPPSREILEAQDAIDQVIVFPRPALSRAATRLRLVSFGAALSDAARALRRPGFDLVIDAQGTYKSGVLARLTGAPVRVGFAAGSAREFLPRAATLRVALPERAGSRVDRALALLKPLGADPGLAAASLPVDGAAAAAATAVWQAERGAPRVLIGAGSSRRQRWKQWPAERFGRLAARLRQSGLNVRLAWGPGEEAIASAVAAVAGLPGLPLPATSVRGLAEVIRQADVYVGNDSGPMHLAWLVGCRVVALYGPTDPVLNAPWGTGPHAQVVAAATDAERRARTADLMERISVEEVEGAVRSLLPA
jgi:lipopolysaccharide heptosyltransferase I